MQKEKNKEYSYYTLDLGDDKYLVGDMKSKDNKKCAQLINDIEILKNPQKLIINNAKKYIKSIENVNCEFEKKWNNVCKISKKY